VAGDSNTYDSAKQDIRLARIVKALPGFNVADAVARLNGNIDFYKELLADLCDSLLAALTELRPLIQNGWGEEALIRMHGLKGMTGNLGAATLTQAFEAVEQALSNYRKSQYDRLITHMERTIQQNLGVIGAFLQEETAPPANPRPPEPDEETLAGSIYLLADLLDQRRLDAIDAFHRLKKLLHRRHKHPEIDYLAAAMRSLDYDSARKALTALAVSMRIDL
jgi:HPt (histidine-containing phosphotransfer) domain-containing protein